MPLILIELVFTIPPWPYVKGPILGRLGPVIVYEISCFWSVAVLWLYFIHREEHHYGRGEGGVSFLFFTQIVKDDSVVFRIQMSPLKR